MKIILTILLALSFTSISLKADWRCMVHLDRFTYLIDFASIGDTLIVAQTVRILETKAKRIRYVDS